MHLQVDHSHTGFSVLFLATTSCFQWEGCTDSVAQSCYDFEQWCREGSVSVLSCRKIGRGATHYVEMQHCKLYYCLRLPWLFITSPITNGAHHALGTMLPHWLHQSCATLHNFCNYYSTSAFAFAFICTFNPSRSAVGKHLPSQSGSYSPLLGGF